MTSSTLELLSHGPFARLMLTNFFFFGALNTFLLLPLYIQRLGGDEADIGLVQGLYSAAGIVCQPVVGALIDYLGRRFFMRLGALLLVVSCALFVVASPLPLLGVLRILQGVAFSAFFVSNYIHVVEMVPVERRGWALGIFGLSGLVSTSLAPLLGEFVIRRFGFPTFFTSTTVIAVVAAALCWGVRDVRPAALGARPGLHVIREGLLELRHMHMAIGLFFGLGTGTIFTFLPTFGENLGITSVGLFYTAYAAAAMLVRVVGGNLIDVRGRRAVIIPCMRISLDDVGRGRGSPERVLPFTGKSVSGLSIARDGTVFALNDGSTNLYAIDVDRAQASAQPRQLTNDDAANSQPDYGPAGRVAYEHRVVGQPISVWTIGDDGKQKELLSAELPMSLRAPQWDAAGKRLFVHIHEPGANRPHFGWLDVDPRQLTRLALPLSITADPPPQLSPDGKRLVFHVIASDGVMNLWTAEIDGGPSRQITFDREAMSYPRWSQDGRAVAMVIKRGDQTHVGVVSAEGGPVEQLTSDSGQSWPHSFSPDNERIAFAGLRNGVWNIYTVSRRAKAVEQLTHFTTAEGHVRYPAWSPRGDRIVFERAARKGSLWMVKLPS